MFTRPLKILIFSLLALIAGLVVYRYESQINRLNDRNEDLLSRLEQHSRNHYPQPSQPLPTAPTPSQPTIESASAANEQQIRSLNEAINSLQQHNSILQENLDTLLRPIDKDILSTTLRTDVRHDEILVTGGFRTIDGNFHYTFVIPASETLDDGSESIRMRTFNLSIAPDTLDSLGLDFLATNAGNTLQHGEIWSIEEFTETFQSAQSLDGAEWKNLPDVTTTPGTPVTVEDGDFTLNARPNLLTDLSGFDLDLRVEQARNPNNPPQD